MRRSSHSFSLKPSSLAIITEYWATRWECWLVRTSLASTAFAMAMTVSLAMFSLICCLFSCRCTTSQVNQIRNRERISSM